MGIAQIKFKCLYLCLNQHCTKKVVWLGSVISLLVRTMLFFFKNTICVITLVYTKALIYMQ